MTNNNKPQRVVDAAAILFWRIAVTDVAPGSIFRELDSEFKDAQVFEDMLIACQDIVDKGHPEAGAITAALNWTLYLEDVPHNYMDVYRTIKRVTDSMTWEEGLYLRKLNCIVKSLGA